MSLLAQAAADLVAIPSVDWAGVMPVILLAAPAMVLLHVSSLVPRFFRGFYALATIVVAGVTAAWAIGLWARVQDAGRGPFSTLGGAYGVDGFSVFLILVICASVALAALLADDYLRREDLEGAEPYALMLLSASGGVIMASSNDLLVLFLGLEVLSLAVYVLAAMHRRRATSQEAGMKYFVLGAFSSAFFLYGIALVYGATGSTNLIAINEYLGGTILLRNGLLLVGLALLLVGFGFKVAAVPFHSWSPDVYQGAPTPMVAYMASGVKAAGFAGLLRVFVKAFETEAVNWAPIVSVLAVATLVVGTVAAVAQTDVKRMMAYSSVSHAGFILLGVLSASDRGTAAALYYLAAYTFMIAGTFGVITLVGGLGDGSHRLADYRGLSRRRPALALALALFLFAQAGMPPTSGFIAKFGVIAAAVEEGWYWLAVVAMVAGVIGAFVYLRLVVTMFGPQRPEEAHGGEADAPAVAEPAPIRIPWPAGVAIGLAAVVTLVIGIVPDLVLEPSRDAVPELVASP
jgi:NADH-quinone oxidoreductase subunit N